MVRIAMKMKELLSADIKAMVDAAIEPLRTEVDEVKASLAKVQQELKQATVRNDDLEQYSRRACLRIAGINETSNEDVAKKVMELILQNPIPDCPGFNQELLEISRRGRHQVGNRTPETIHPR